MLTCFEVNAYLFSGKARLYRLKRAVLRLRKLLDMLLFPPVHPEKNWESQRKEVFHTFLIV
ncbi:hypothetical protein FSA08_06420 [Bacteroides fragilis]|uniref:Uncharacterized protein n=1 Tax=Bacteroides fragilis TaxID=817 RepID=A0A5C6LCN2_BACFG|nr:hypothetical protein M081_3653 [Bacteroides fragilis str. 3998 T(B) 4]TWV76174.1 hypothetical protein FSA08_06420 [Bacteroides fragilis]